MLNYSDDELKFVVKSLSISYDATSKRLDRLDGRHYDDALEDLELCEQALTKSKAELMVRRRQDRVYPIGVTVPDSDDDWNRK